MRTLAALDGALPLLTGPMGIKHAVRVSDGCSIVIGMDERRGLPDGLVTMAPGPELAALLATIDRSAVAAEDLHDLLAASTYSPASRSSSRRRSIRSPPRPTPGTPATPTTTPIPGLKPATVTGPARSVAAA